MVVTYFRVAEPLLEAAKNAAQRDGDTLSDVLREGLRLALLEHQRRYERRNVECTNSKL